MRLPSSPTRERKRPLPAHSHSAMTMASDGIQEARTRDREEAREITILLEEAERRRRMREQPRAFHFAFGTPPGHRIFPSRRHEEQHDNVVAYLILKQQQQIERQRSVPDDAFAAAAVAHAADETDEKPTVRHTGAKKASAESAVRQDGTARNWTDTSDVPLPRSADALIQSSPYHRALYAAKQRREHDRRSRDEAKAQAIQMEEAERRQRMRNNPRSYHLSFQLPWSDRGGATFNPGFASYHKINFREEQQRKQPPVDAIWQAAQLAHLADAHAQAVMASANLQSPRVDVSVKGDEAGLVQAKHFSPTCVAQVAWGLSDLMDQLPTTKHFDPDSSAQALSSKGPMNWR